MRALLVLAGCCLMITPLWADYDPFAVPKRKAVVKDFTIQDKQRDREIPVRVYLPDAKTAAPVILFSHGLGGSCRNSPYLGNHWSARGYVVVFMQHHGSDEAVWKESRPLQRMKAMREAANAKNWLARVQDVPAVIDQLERWNKDGKHTLSGRMDLKHLGMCGHSFGAITTQAVSGQTMPLGRGYTDTRIKAAVAFSPSAPRAGDAGRYFGRVNIPWMLMTGTNDTSPIGNATVESRLAVFPALPKGSKYQVVFDKAEHSAFSDRALPGDKQRRNPNHHRAILALSTAFWDTHLRGDKSARTWLNGDGPKRILEKNDRWEKK